MLIIVVSFAKMFAEFHSRILEMIASDGNDRSQS